MLLAALLSPKVHSAVEGPVPFDELIQDGLRSLYNLDYEGARRTFDRLARDYPQHPMGLYALTTTDWWELTNEFDEQNPSLERRFIDRADAAVKNAKQMIRVGDPLGEAHLCLGGALGLISRWEAIQGSWLSAYRHGKQAYNAQKKATELNPQLYDAYLGVGIFHYYTATLPRVVKLLASLVFGGNKQEGLAQIRLAMEKGRFSRTAARLFLVGIYNNSEKDYVQALALVREGRREYPQSSFFHFVEILTLNNARDWTTLRREANDFLARIDRKEPSYWEKYRHRAYFALGDGELGEGRAREAIVHYDRAVGEALVDDRWVSLALLSRGKAYDLLGRREKATADYRAVLKRRNVWGLHDQAEELLSKPYRPS